MSFQRNTRGEDRYEALLNQDQEILEGDATLAEQMGKKNAYEKSFCLSKILFSWVTPLARVRYYIILCHVLISLCSWV